MDLTVKSTDALVSSAVLSNRCAVVNDLMSCLTDLG